MSWLWLNMLLAAPFFTACTAIPLWLVVKHPDTGPETSDVTVPSRGHGSRPAGPAAAHVSGCGDRPPVDHQPVMSGAGVGPAAGTSKETR